MFQSHCSSLYLKSLNHLETFVITSYHVIFTSHQHLVDKFVLKKMIDPPKWNLLKPVAFDIDARLLETMLGHNSKHLYECQHSIDYCRG